MKFQVQYEHYGVSDEVTKGVDVSVKLVEVQMLKSSFECKYCNISRNASDGGSRILQQTLRQA